MENRTPPVVQREPRAAPRAARPPAGWDHLWESAKRYTLNEETLILLEFLIVVTIGLVVAVNIYHPMENFVASLTHAFSKLPFVSSGH